MCRISPCWSIIRFLLLLSLTQFTTALSFNPIGGPYAIDTPVPISWVLDGTEPLDGWELWFNGGGVSQNVANIPFSVVSTVVAFPGFNGTFQGLDGLTSVLATSLEVDALPQSGSLTGTSTFQASQTSGGNAHGPLSGTGTAAGDQTGSGSSGTASAVSGSPHTTEALLGIIVGTLAVIAIIVIASIMLFVHRRRRTEGSGDMYPFERGDVEKQLAAAKRITPFPPARIVTQPESLTDSDERSVSMIRSPDSGSWGNSREGSPTRLPAARVAPPRGSIAPNAQLPLRGRPMGPRAPLSPPLPPLPTESRGTAYLDAQLAKIARAQALEGQQQQRPSILVTGRPRASSVARPEVQQRPNIPATLQATGRPRASSSARLEVPLSPRMPPPRPPAAIGIPEPATSTNSKRDVYLSQQLTRLDISERRTPNEGGSIMFSPLSTVPSEQTEPTPTTSLPNPHTRQSLLSASTAVNSPIMFRRPSEPTSDTVLSPQTPRAYVPPW